MILPFESIHIAGTNGKGSTAAYAGAILQAVGRKCGVYTSPHVMRPEERIRIDGADIPAAEFKRLMEKHKDAPTFFHAYTYSAFDWFAENRVEIAVLETGLGGRLDPTSEADSGVAVFTSIGLDHTDVLGTDVAAIAREKCGILRPGMRTVTCSQLHEVMAVIRRECSDRGCPLTVVEDTDITLISRGLEGQRFDLRLKDRTLANLFIPMLGLSQPKDAALAIAACLACGSDEAAVRAGVANARAFARLEVFPGPPPLVLDGAHNVDSARELAETLKLYFPEREIVLITAVMADKDVEGILAIFAQFAGTAFTVRADERRGCGAETLAKILSRYGVPAQTCSSVAEGLGRAREAALQKGSLLVVAGSFKLAGQARELITAK